MLKTNLFVSFISSSGLWVPGLVILEESLLDKENIHVPNSYYLFSLKSAPWPLKMTFIDTRIFV